MKAHKDDYDEDDSLVANLVKPDKVRDKECTTTSLSQRREIQRREVVLDGLCPPNQLNAAILAQQQLG